MYRQDIVASIQLSIVLHEEAYGYKPSRIRMNSELRAALIGNRDLASRHIERTENVDKIMGLELVIDETCQRFIVE